MKVLKLIENNSGFSCEGCVFDTGGHGCNITEEAIGLGDCNADSIFMVVSEGEKDVIAK
jgi:hypothetical protein